MQLGSPPPGRVCVCVLNGNLLVRRIPVFWQVSQVSQGPGRDGRGCTSGDLRVERCGRCRASQALTHPLVLAWVVGHQCQQVLDGPAHLLVADAHQLGLLQLHSRSGENARRVRAGIRARARGGTSCAAAGRAHGRRNSRGAGAHAQLAAAQGHIGGVAWTHNPAPAHTHARWIEGRQQHMHTRAATGICGQAHIAAHAPSLLPAAAVCWNWHTPASSKRRWAGSIGSTATAPGTCSGLQ